MKPDHWWPMMAGDVPIPSDSPPEEALMLRKPPDWEFFTQPLAASRPDDEHGDHEAGHDFDPYLSEAAGLLRCPSSIKKC